MKLEELAKGVIVEGIEPDGPVTVVNAQWIGEDSVELFYKDSSSKPGSTLLYRINEPRMRLVSGGEEWNFGGDGRFFRLAAEAKRIQMAYLFDPLLAVHTSLVDPYPHQISAVYERMLRRQPLRFLLADDPDAGKTIMAGLLMKELIARRDLERCLVCCPGSLIEQWQDELGQKSAGLLLQEESADGRPGPFARDPEAVRRVENLAMQAVMDSERALGNEPRDVSKENRGFDVESKDGKTSRLRMAEVKGCAEGADSVTVTRNEIVTALDRPDDYILALVGAENGLVCEPRYVRQPFKNEPDFHVYSVNYKLEKLLEGAEPPSLADGQNVGERL